MNSFKTLAFILLLTAVHLPSVQAQGYLPKSTNSFAERLTGQTTYFYYSDGFKPRDTTFYTYSGTRNKLPSGTPAYDQETFDLYDTGTHVYYADYQYHHFFDGGDNLGEDNVQVWFAGEYENQDSDIYTYDGNHNMLTHVSLTYIYFNYVGWVDSLQTAYNYDANNNNTASTTQLWNINTNAWVNSQRVFHTYNTLNQITADTTQVWDTIGSAWVYYSQRDYSYDSSGRLSGYYTQEYYGFWQNDEQMLYTYDAHGNITKEIRQIWDGSTWKTEDESLNSYSAGNDRIIQVNKGLISSALVNIIKDSATYDSNHNELTDITLKWNAANTSWDNKSRITNTYDSYNSITSSTNDTWLNNAWQFAVYNRQYLYYYDTFTVSGIHSLPQDLDLHLYPSPSSELVQIKIEGLQTAPAVLTIYDASGRIQRQWQTTAGNTYQTTIPVSSFPAGIYYLDASNSSGKSERSFVVTH